MDKSTLQELLDEATEGYLESKAEFEDTDCCDSMHQMNEWRRTMHWLQGKLDKETK